MKARRLETKALSTCRSESDQKSERKNLPGEGDTEDETEIAAERAERLEIEVGPKPPCFKKCRK